MFWNLKRKLKKIENATLFLSGGSRSRLLLEVMLAEKMKFSIVRFDDLWTLEQKRSIDQLIMNRGMRVYSYLPASGMLISDGNKGLAYATSYAIDADGAMFPVVRKIKDGLACAVDMKTQYGFGTPPIDFENIIVGSGKSRKIGNVNIHAPIGQWSQTLVKKALKRLDTSNTVDSVILTCTNCLRPHSIGMAWCLKTNALIPLVKWNAESNRQQWQKENQA